MEEAGIFITSIYISAKIAVKTYLFFYAITSRMKDCLKLKETQMNYITKYYTRLLAKQADTQKFAVEQTTLITLIYIKN